VNPSKERFKILETVQVERFSERARSVIVTRAGGISKKVLQKKRFRHEVNVYMSSPTKLPRISDREFQARIARTAQLTAEAGLDVLIVHSNEADFANVRYLSDYWPLFESAGVLVSPDGQVKLLIGPESETFSRSRTKIPDVRKLVEYREPAEPDYPSIQVDSFRSLILETIGHEPKRIGLVGWAIFPLPVYKGLREAFPNAELVKADNVLFQQRAIKSPDEVACLKEAFRITRAATDEVIRRLKPGMTELEIAGISQSVIYAEGAEYEGLPQYVLSGPASGHAIGRAGYRAIGKGDIVQLNLSARVHGYSASIGVPVSLGKPSDAAKTLLEFGLKAHTFTRTLMLPGTPAREVALRYDEFVKNEGFAEYQLYGPCHGLGMIEVERPWIETTSDYSLEPGMTFQLDTYFYTPAGSAFERQNGGAFGLRWENGCLITPNGSELLGPQLTSLVEVEA
jgi:Xaa-Pro aminopeptidase